MKTVKMEDIRAQSPDQLKDRVIELKKEQFNMRFQRAAGQMEATSRVKQVRREIARIKTVLGQPAGSVVPKTAAPKTAKATSKASDKAAPAKAAAAKGKK